MGIVALLPVLELWASSMGDLMKTATSVQLIDVASVGQTQLGTRVTGALLEQWHGSAKIGAPISVDLGSFFAGAVAPKVGDRFLVVCDAGECPRAIAVERDGLFQLHAQEPMDGAYVTPPIVAHTSLPTLAAGKPTPALCVRATVSFLDEPKAKPLALTAQIDAAKGSGTATIGTLSTRATLGFTDAANDALVLSVGSARSTALIASPAGWVRAKDGCIKAAMAPSRSVVRTRASFERALTKPQPPAKFATGSVTVRGKAHPFSLALDDYGQLVLTSDLATGKPNWEQSSATAHAWGFQVSSSTTYPMVTISIAAPIDRDLPTTLAKARSLKVTFGTLASSANPPSVDGTATVTYVPEP